jgi:hypothetical protein
MRIALLPRVPHALAALGAGLVVLVPSCGTATGTTTTAADGAAVVVVEPPPEPAGAPADRVDPVERVTVPRSPVRAVSRDDLHHEVRATPQDVWVDADRPDLLHVSFVAGAAPCHGARVAVDESDATVRVLLWLGTPPEGLAAPCDPTFVAHELLVPLGRALGSRELLY